MSTTTSHPNSASTSTAAPQGERGPKMNGAEILVEALEREGVDTIFAYPGGASHGHAPGADPLEENPHHPAAP